MEIHIVVKIDKTNYPNTEPEDVSVMAFGTLEDATRWMKRDFRNTCKHKHEACMNYWAFKNDDEHEVLWVIK